VESIIVTKTDSYSTCANYFGEGEFVYQFSKRNSVGHRTLEETAK
jgi:hypothetical protein